MDDETVVRVMNEWMRRFTEDPDAFQQQFASAMQFVQEEGSVIEPTYGRACLAWMKKLEEETK